MKVSTAPLDRLDDSTASLDAICEMLYAAREEKLSASCVHTLLKPVSLNLNQLAGQMRDDDTQLNP